MSNMDIITHQTLDMHESMGNKKRPLEVDVDITHYTYTSDINCGGRLKSRRTSQLKLVLHCNSQLLAVTRWGERERERERERANTYNNWRSWYISDEEYIGLLIFGEVFLSLYVSLHLSLDKFLPYYAKSNTFSVVNLLKAFFVYSDRLTLI